jgi:TPP-dependent pyruvate/acetoin dehydrogenase alpha subunit
MEIKFEINPEEIKAVFLEDIQKEVEWYMEKFNLWDDDEISKAISKAVKKEVKKQLKENKKNIEEMVQEAITEHTKDIALELLNRKDF